jgi:hypothetical protein
MRETRVSQSAAVRNSRGMEHADLPPDVDPVSTRAIRSGSAQVLRDELHRLLVDGESTWVRDWRDLLIALAPLYDCARRLGLDPATVFSVAAAEGPPTLAEHVKAFGARTDIALAAFGFRLDEEAPGGPAYRFAWPG